MSRSYKKHAWVTDGKDGRKYAKRLANKAVRNCKDVPNGKAYKKIFCSYNIHDYKSRWPWQEALKNWYNTPFLQEKYPKIKDFYRYWQKHYQMK